MSSYGCVCAVFSKPASRIVATLPREVQEVLVKHAHTLKTEPMKGEQLKGAYRVLRSLHLSYQETAYCVIYQVVSKSQTVSILPADKCENIYRRLEEMRT